MIEVLIVLILTFIICKINCKIHVIPMDGVELWFAVFVTILIFVLFAEGLYFFLGG